LIGIFSAENIPINLASGLGEEIPLFSEQMTLDGK
jgi:hypothetical protein